VHRDFLITLYLIGWEQHWLCVLCRPLPALSLFLPSLACILDSSKFARIKPKNFVFGALQNPGLGITDQHYVLIITPLFDTQAPTCFGIHVPSSGSFLYPYELLEGRNGYVVCLKAYSRYIYIHYILSNNITVSAFK
jgi:hypothetical protein